MLHLGRLRALCEVADRGTIAAAAQALHLTPSAVSQQIAAMERELGERLVEPDGRRVRLTPVGRVLVRGADAVFAEVESLRSEVARYADGDRADLRVGSFASAIARIVAPAARRLRNRSPGVGLEVVEAEGEEAFAALARHELDILVSIEGPGAPPLEDPRVARSALGADPLLAVLPVGHELAREPQVALADLAREPWVLPPEGWTCEGVITAGCHAAGFTPRVVHRTGDWQAVAALCGAGLGVGLIPELGGVRGHDGVAVRPLEPPAPRRHIFAACRRGAEDAPPIAAVMACLREAAGRGGRPMLEVVR
jgi:DNA-binding transcriptional LysR family regulator